MSNLLLGIDPQNDFTYLGGSLYVKGARNDMRRAAEFLERNSRWIAHVVTTMDKHNFYDVGHPCFWCDASGETVEPFTTITSEDIRTRKYVPADKTNWAYDDMLAYAVALESSGRYPITVWPYHCIYGMPGADVNAHIRQGIINWETHAGASGRFPYWVTKGMFAYREHYSAFKTEVPYPREESTLPNLEFFRQISGFDVFVYGEAADYCVMSTLRDLFEYALASGDSDFIPRFTLLTDCTSALGSTAPESPYGQFLVWATGLGMKLAKSTDINLEPKM